MSKGKAPETTSELLDRLANFLGDGSGQSLEDLEDELRGVGIDADSVVGRVQELVTSTIEANRLAWRERAREERAQALRHLGEPRLPWTDESNVKLQVLNLLTALSEHGAVPGVQAYWRKFEQATEHDLRVLLEDLQRLQELRKLSEGDSDDAP